MATQGTNVIRAGAMARMALGRLEKQLILSGMLAQHRINAMAVIRAGLVIVLDYMPSGLERAAEMGDTTVSLTIQRLLGA